MLLATGRPSAAVGVDLRKTSLVEVGQIDLARLRLLPERLYLLSAALESGFISFFLRLWRVRFHTNPPSFR